MNFLVTVLLVFSSLFLSNFLLAINDSESRDLLQPDDIVKEEASLLSTKNKHLHCLGRVPDLSPLQLRLFTIFLSLQEIGDLWPVSRTGFLGPKDTLLEVYLKDQQTLAECGVSFQQIAETLRTITTEYRQKIKQIIRSRKKPERFNAELVAQYQERLDELSPEAKKFVKGGVTPSVIVTFNNMEFLVKAETYIGFQVCPFAGGLSKYKHDYYIHRKECGGGTDFSIFNLKTGATLCFNDLLIHLIEYHAFFEGDVVHRLDPIDVINFFELRGENHDYLVGDDAYRQSFDCEGMVADSRSAEIATLQRSSIDRKTGEIIIEEKVLHCHGLINELSKIDRDVCGLVFNWFHRIILHSYFLRDKNIKNLLQIFENDSKEIAQHGVTRDQIADVLLTITEKYKRMRDVLNESSQNYDPAQRQIHDSILRSLSPLLNSLRFLFNNQNPEVFAHHHPIVLDNYVIIRIQMYAAQACPFVGGLSAYNARADEPFDMINEIGGQDYYWIFDLETNKMLCFNDLIIHLIRRHGFFGDDFSDMLPEELAVYNRIEPGQIIDFFKLKPGRNYAPHYYSNVEWIYVMKGGDISPCRTLGETTEVVICRDDYDANLIHVDTKKINPNETYYRVEFDGHILMHDLRGPKVSTYRLKRVYSVDATLSE